MPVADTAAKPDIKWAPASVFFCCFQDADCPSNEPPVRHGRRGNSASMSIDVCDADLVPDDLSETFRF